MFYLLQQKWCVSYNSQQKKKDGENDLTAIFIWLILGKGEVQTGQNMVVIILFSNVTC